jgi:hypothetical protein
MVKNYALASTPDSSDSVEHILSHLVWTATVGGHLDSGDLPVQR